MYYSLETPSLLAPTPPAGARQLIILLHGTGSRPAEMTSMAESFRAAWPTAAIAIPEGLQPFDAGLPGRYQWFSLAGITEANRPDRIAAVLPSFIELIRGIQETAGVPPTDTVLAGFSQGAIMALEAVKQADGLAGRVLAFAGRYGRLPTEAPKHTSISFYHGDQDEVIAVKHAQEAFEELHELGADVTLDVGHGVGHEVHPALLSVAVERLQKEIPARLWRKALTGQ
ncbi:MAG: esterase [Moraxellaceae bacterium]